VIAYKAFDDGAEVHNIKPRQREAFEARGFTVADSLPVDLQTAEDERQIAGLIDGRLDMEILRAFRYAIVNELSWPQFLQYLVQRKQDIERDLRG